ncbi:MAG: TIGR03936 family radical SAM-associated protein [Antricoccus sp.]
MSERRPRKQRAPTGPPPPPVAQRLWIRYTKTGRLRFMSHRDFARAFERAIRRAKLPIGFSAGFTPHPKISWVGAAPTGVASEAEYVEIGLTEQRDPEEVRVALNDSLPADLDICECVPATGKSLAERVTASEWQFTFTQVSPALLREAVEHLIGAEQVTVQRLTQTGRKSVDVRGPLVGASVSTGPSSDCAIMTMVVRQSTPVIRPDDVYAALHDVAGLVPPVPPSAVRLRQGDLDAADRLVDPLGYQP